MSQPPDHFQYEHGYHLPNDVYPDTDTSYSPQQRDDKSQQWGSVPSAQGSKVEQQGLFVVTSVPSQPQRANTGWKNILLYLSIIALPITGVTVLLLVYISQNQVYHTGVFHDLLVYEDMTDRAGELYLRADDSSHLNTNTIASWASTVATNLIMFFMLLYTFPVAHSMMKREAGKEPTPYQFALMIQLLTGSIGSLWAWLRYASKRTSNGSRQTQPPLMRFLSTFVICIMLLSLLVFGAETWLQATTQPRAMVQAVDVSLNSPAANVSYGLIPECLKGNNSFAEGSAFDSCVVVTPSYGSRVTNPGLTYLVMNNASRDTTIRVFHHEGKDHAYLTPAAPSSLLDYHAHTVSVQTKCRAASSQCGLKPARAACCIEVDCPFALNPFNTANKNGLLISYFTDETMQDNMTIRGIHNPYHFALFNQHPADTRVLKDAKEIAFTGHGEMAFILACNTTVYDVEYTSVNGTMTVLGTKPANDSVANLVQGTQLMTRIADRKLLEAAIVAGYQSDVPALAEWVAIEYSKMALAVASSGFMKRAALAAQYRKEPIIVNVVQLAPLYTLVGLNCLLIMMGLVLAGVALWTVRGKGEQSLGVADLQQRLNVSGLVADRYERERAAFPAAAVDKLFSENVKRGGGGPSRRVVIHRTEVGGTTFEVKQRQHGNQRQFDSI